MESLKGVAERGVVIASRHRHTGESSVLHLAHGADYSRAMWQDIRLAVRGFRKTPVFSFVAIGTLALACGATIALFSLLNALLLRELPVRDPRTLVQISSTRPPLLGSSIKR